MGALAVVLARSVYNAEVRNCIQRLPFEAATSTTTNLHSRTQ